MPIIQRLTVKRSLMDEYTVGELRYGENSIERNVTYASAMFLTLELKQSSCCYVLRCLE